MQAVLRAPPRAGGAGVAREHLWGGIPNELRLLPKQPLFLGGRGAGAGAVKSFEIRSTRW